MIMMKNGPLEVEAEVSRSDSMWTYVAQQAISNDVDKNVSVQLSRCMFLCSLCLDTVYHGALLFIL